MRISKILFVLFLSCSIGTLHAQQKLTSKLLIEIDRVGDPQLSPDGKWVVYGVRDYVIDANRSYNTLYIQSVEGGEPAKLTDASVNAFSPRWRPDGARIGYLAVTDGAPQLFEVDAKGGNKKQVTSIQGGLENFSYSPDMKYIMFTQEVKVDKTIQEKYPDLQLDKVNAVLTDELDYRHWDTWNDANYSHVFFMNYDNGSVSGQPKDIMPNEKFDAPVKPFGGAEQLTWSPDGKKIVYTSKKLGGTNYAVSTNTDLYEYSVTTGENHNLTMDNEGYDNNPAFSPDGKLLAYQSMQKAGYESDKNRLMLYNYADNSRKELTKGFDQSVEQFVWSRDGKAIYFISGTNATKQVYRYDLTAKNNNIKQITSGMHDYTTIDVAMNGKKTVLVGIKMSISSPPALYSINPSTGEEKQLSTANNELLANVKMGKVEKRMVTATDGKQILTWVIYPPDFDPNKKYPALLYAQGGPQSAVSQFFSSRWNFQLMAANGYIVVAPNRRGLPTFGQDWNDAIIGDYGGQPMQDLLSAIDNVSKEPFVDKERLGAIGASFGGFSVYWLAGHNESKRFKTFIAHAGMFNMESWYGSTEEMFFANNDQKGPYWENPEPYESFSPHKFVDKWNTPILIIHGEKDYRVPVTQGMEAFTAAQLKGVPSQFLYFPDENHWILKPQNAMLWQAVFYDWLDKYLKK